MKTVWILLALMFCVFGGSNLYREWEKAKQEQAERSQPQRFDQKFEQAVGELRVEEMAVGSGAEAVRGKKVTIHYLGKLPDGPVFDSSRDRKQTVSFPLGVAQALPAWDHGIEGMKVGGKRRIFAPPFLAYGEAGVGQVVPPNSPVIFEVELLAVGEADDPLTLQNRKSAARARSMTKAPSQMPSQSRVRAPSTPRPTPALKPRRPDPAREAIPAKKKKSKKKS